MLGAFVQGWQEDGDGGTVTECTVTVSGATANNILVASLTIFAGGDSIDSHTGWTPVVEDTSVLDRAYCMYTRVASGTSADDFHVEWTDNGRYAAIVQEFSGLDSSPYEDHDIDINTTAVTSQDCGTATPVTSDGVAVAAWLVENEAGASIGTDTLPSGYSNKTETDVTGTNRAFARQASLVYSSTSDQSPVWSTSDVGSRGAGIVAVFKAAGGGGPAAHPVYPFGHALTGPFGGPI